MSTTSHPKAPSPWSFALALHVLLLASVFLAGPAEGAVRAGGRGSSFSRAAKHPASPVTHRDQRRGGKSYACPQDLAQPGPIGPVHFRAGGDHEDARQATLLMEDRPVALIDEPDVDTDDDIEPGSGTNVSSASFNATDGNRSGNHFTARSRRYTIHLPETSPLSITISPACVRKEDSDVVPNWWVLHEGRYISAQTDGIQFFRPCQQRGLYQVLVNVTGLPAYGSCPYRIGYNRKGTEEFRNWPFRNMTAPSRIKVQQQRRRYVVMIKWEKSKLDIHVMNYCLAVSIGQRQRTLCQALGNSIHRPACESIAINDFLHRLTPRDQRKLDPDVSTTIVCTGTRTRQLIRGMKPNVTYFVDVFAIHSQHNNLSFLLGSTQVQLNRTRPTQLVEGKVVVGKLSMLGGLALFNFKVPKRSPNNFFKLHLTPCGGSVNVEILKKKDRIETARDVYYPKTIIVRNVRPGERYLIRVSEADDTSRMNRVQMAVTSRDNFIDLPRMPSNTTITELVPLRKCHSSTIAWFGSPEKDVTYCVYVFKLSKTQYYNNVKIPTYCELENRDVCNHPQFHNKHCFNGNDFNPLSLDIPNLLPEHYYSVFVTAIPPRGRSLPYKSVRIKTSSFCADSNQIFPSGTANGKLIVKGGFRKGGGHKRRNTPNANVATTGNSLAETGSTKRAQKAPQRQPTH
uniref:Protein NDNF n=1 Tax=Anopheles atroparvus TaxID=41427 RepID=A0A182JCN9_ANOAO